MSDDVSEDDIIVRNNPEADRYELFVGEHLAGLATYRLDDGTMTIPHTEVMPRYEGRGLGARLARFALDDARERGLKVVPACEFIDAYIRRHPEYRDMLAG